MSLFPKGAQCRRSLKDEKYQPLDSQKLNDKSFDRSMPLSLYKQVIAKASSVNGLP